MFRYKILLRETGCWEAGGLPRPYASIYRSVDPKMEGHEAAPMITEVVTGHQTSILILIYVAKVLVNQLLDMGTYKFFFP